MEPSPIIQKLRCVAALGVLLLCSCHSSHGDGSDAKMTSLGTVEVTARLVEVQPKAIVNRQLYDYAAILKYEVLSVHRGALKKGDVIYVAHYNPFKPRASAADKRIKDIGGNVAAFFAGEIHRLAMEVPLDEHYLGAIVNEYFDANPSPLYWAVWTNMADAP